MSKPSASRTRSTTPVGEPVAQVDARDVAAVAATVLTGEGHAGEAYAVTGAEAFTYHDAAAALSEELGREIEHVKVGMDYARAGMLDAGMPEGLVDDYVSLLEWYETGGGVKVYPTIEDVTRKPARSIETFVSDYASAFEA
jgi:nucleoside-diphosphate-sugar epimerase